MNHFESRIASARQALSGADCVLIGGGAGLSTAAGLSYSGKRFREYFPDFIEKYGFTDMYSAGFYPFPAEEERWAYWARHIYVNRYLPGATPLYQDLLAFVEGKKYFVITTNVDSQFQKAGFPPGKIFAVQGDYGFLQCAKGCHYRLYYNEKLVSELLSHTKNCRVPPELVPHCPVCGGKMAVHLRCDHFFVENSAWHEAENRYKNFLQSAQGRIVLLELGVGFNTPGIIKYPFWQMTAENPKAAYVCINYGEAYCPEEIKKQAICIDDDIGAVLEAFNGTNL